MKNFCTFSLKFLVATLMLSVFGYMANAQSVGIGSAQFVPSAMLHIKPITLDAIRIDPFNTAAGNTGQLEFMELAANGTHYVAFKAPDNIAASKVWVLPNVDGSSGQVLKTDGSGNLSWVTQSGGSSDPTLVYTCDGLMIKFIIAV